MPCRCGLAHFLKIVPVLRVRRRTRQCRRLEMRLSRGRQRLSGGFLWREFWVRRPVKLSFSCAFYFLRLSMTALIPAAKRGGTIFAKVRQSFIFGRRPAILWLIAGPDQGDQH